MIYTAIVFLPLLGALIAGLFGRAIGDRPSEFITTAFLMICAVLSWIVLFQVGFGHETHKVAVARWITSGDLDVSWMLRIDTLWLGGVDMPSRSDSRISPFRPETGPKAAAKSSMSVLNPP